MMTVDDVLDVVLKDADFYHSSQGGVTLSGGEPLYQSEFVLALLNKCRQFDLHTAIESNMAWPWKDVGH
jgi:pyruvate formate lyase activating enzyme